VRAGGGHWGGGCPGGAKVACCCMQSPAPVPWQQGCECASAQNAAFLLQSVRAVVKCLCFYMHITIEAASVMQMTQAATYQLHST
jgi:hypothetical protein